MKCSASKLVKTAKPQPWLGATTRKPMAQCKIPRPVLTWCTILGMFSAASPANAQEEVREFGTAGDYEVFGVGSSRDEAGSCLATFIYEGSGSTKTTLSRIADKNDLIYLSVTNSEWTSEEKKEYNLTYQFDGKYYDRTAWGVNFDYVDRGFMTAFPVDDFLAIFSKSSYLNIYMDDVVVDRLSLSGSSAGVSLLNRCWIWLQSTERAARAERDRFKDIPRDPFAEEKD